MRSNVFGIAKCRNCCHSKRSATFILGVSRSSSPPPSTVPQMPDDDGGDNNKLEDALNDDAVNNNNNTNNNMDSPTTSFRWLVEEAMNISERNDPETHLPRFLANNLQLVVGIVSGQDGMTVINDILEEATHKGGQPLHNRTLQVVETILSFAESFVQQAQEMDNQNKHLLGRIIKAMGSARREVIDDDNKTPMPGDVWGEEEYCGDPTLTREQRLDEIMEMERDNFTPGFIRHLDGECNRIANAPQMTTESKRLLEMIRIIQTRVLEEVGKDLGEAAVVLGQLLGHEKDEELVGVLEAGLTVRGRDFAVEMKQHTTEALNGFRTVHGGADPELVDRVTLVDKRLQVFLDDTNEFQ